MYSKVKHIIVFKTPEYYIIRLKGKRDTGKFKINRDEWRNE